MTIQWTTTDTIALQQKDAAYFTDKGATYYVDGTYDQAIEYYRIAASMGEVQAQANLGYCYLYGRSIETDIELAIAYFKLAAMQHNIDAFYKLGDIYSKDKWGKKDSELSVYYYQCALNEIFNEPYDVMDILHSTTLSLYPSLALALGKAHLPEGLLLTDLQLSYVLLLKAKEGYEQKLQNGESMYQFAYKATLSLLEHPQFDIFREEE